MDLAATLQNSRAPGRSYILHTTDSPPSAHPVPTHVIGYRTQTAKIGTYSYWTPETGDILAADRDVELYDYSTPGGRSKLDNDAAAKPKLFSHLDDALTHDAIPNELRQPLTGSLKQVSDGALQTYYDYVAKLGTGEVET